MSKTARTSVSLPISQLEFLQQRDLSASRILQRAIQEKQQEEREGIELSKQSLLKKVGRLQETIGKMRDFLQEKNLIDDFIKIL